MSLNGLRYGGQMPSKPLPNWQSNVGIVLLFVFVVPVFLVGVMLGGKPVKNDRVGGSPRD